MTQLKAAANVQMPVAPKRSVSTDALRDGACFASTPSPGWAEEAADLVVVETQQAARGPDLSSMPEGGPGPVECAVLVVGWPWRKRREASH